MRYGFWAVAVAPAALALIVVAAACGAQSDHPPVLNNLSEGGHLGGGVGGGGGGGSSGNACGQQGGQCLRSGDIGACPQPDLTENLCGAPLNDAETSGLFCCFGLNDAGTTDVITD
jgi:hypothetical protein